MYTKEQKERKSNYEKILKKVEQSMKGAYPEIHLIWHFGAVEYGAQYLVQCIAFKTDMQLQQAILSGECDRMVAYWKDIMIRYGWPLEAFEKKVGELVTQCDFASQEACDREFAGNWWYYYK